MWIELIHGLAVLYVMTDQALRWAQRRHRRAMQEYQWDLRFGVDKEV